MMQDNLVALATATPAANTAGTELPSLLLVGGGAAVVGIAIGAFAALLIGAGRAKRSKAEAERLVEDAKAEARREADATKLEAERQALVRKEKAAAEFAAARTALRETERRLGKREDLLDRKEQQLADREQRLDERSAKADARAKEADDRFEQAESLVDQQAETLQRLSGLDADRARELLLERVEERERDAVGKRVREIDEQAEEQSREKAREITLQAIQRFAAETTSESTVRAVAIPSDEMKGRIIGREGRNIRAIEKSTGADIIVDDTPGVIVVSCFDKVRQATAVEARERLIGDGRLHPTRIEEVVEKVRAEVAERVIKFGKEAAAEAGVRGLHPKVIEAMGKMHYRTSYGQNVLKHSIEVAFMSQIIAEQVGLDGRLARRCGFLHDIGKAMDHEMEGGHPAIGMQFARQYGEKDEAVLNAIGGHHADIPSTTFYTPIVMAADAVSSARPGARRESMERYVQRLTELESIALDQPGVTEAHAVQAGREVRVMIDADRVSDDEAYLIAHNIARRVSDEMTFPGEVRVTVLRETRAIELAR